MSKRSGVTLPHTQAKVSIFPSLSSAPGYGMEITIFDSPNFDNPPAADKNTIIGPCVCSLRLGRWAGGILDCKVTAAAAGWSWVVT
jgi:hypothetical protein